MNPKTQPTLNLDAKRIGGLKSPYFISAQGYVYTLNENLAPVKLTPTIGKAGYKVVEITLYGKKVIKRIDKLVGENFVPKIFYGDYKPEKVNLLIHKDGNKLNDAYENLKWGSEWQLEYFRLKLKEEKTKKPAVANKAKIGGINVYDAYTKATTNYKSPKEASELLGISASKIRAALRKKTKIANYTFSL